MCPFHSNNYAWLTTPPPISKLDVRRALDRPNPFEVAGHDGLSPKVLKALSSRMAPVLAKMITLHLKLNISGQEIKLFIV